MKETIKVILNIAAGKMNPIDLNKIEDYLLINLDIMYYDAMTPKELEALHDKVMLSNKEIRFCNADAFEFMERTKFQFDEITIYRFLEHVKKTDVLYFIYLLSTVLSIGGEVDIIVPNYETLAQRILDEDVKSPTFEADDIITTFELLNEVNSPHTSVWTPGRAKHFFELEGRFKVDIIDSAYNYDGRDIYLRFKAKRNK